MRPNLGNGLVYLFCACKIFVASNILFLGVVTLGLVFGRSIWNEVVTVIRHQPMGVWSQTDTQVTAFFEEDSSLVSVSQLAPFPKIRRELSVWEQMPSDVDGCIDLGNSKRAVPTAALTSPNCPTLMVLDEVRALGWNAVNRKVIHKLGDDGNPTKDFDCRDADTSKKVITKHF